VPAATPLPRGPSVLTLYDAGDLLTAPGCPVCRYATEASDRYLRWFALEGHAQPDTITRLCSCLGPCAGHARRLMSQPGAAIRMTAVYRYVVTAARDRLAGRADRVTTCPACDHDAAAAGRALDTLIEGLADSATMYRCRELGGVCLPHLAAAASTGRGQLVAWLTQTIRDAIATRGRPLGWLAGTDPDAETRAVLRRSVPATGLAVRAACPLCLAAAQAERDALDRLTGLASAGPDPSLTLCAGHLADAAIAAGVQHGLRVLLTWQVGCLTARLDSGRAHWLRAGRRRRAPAAGDCAVCRVRRDAAQRVLADLSAARRLRAGPALCVRHHLVLRVADPRGGQALAPAAVETADVLIAELEDAFDSAARAHRRGAAARDSGTWRRAAAFLDGAVFGGYPARPQ
jgi:hypothetical protein